MNDYTEGQQVQFKVQGEIVTGEYLGWHEQYGMAIVNYNGKRLYRKLQGNVSGVIAGRSLHAAPVKQSRFDVNTRFGFIEDVTNMVITGESNSVIITGSGGLGKTFTVMHCLAGAKFVETSGEPLDDEDGDEGLDENTDEQVTPAGVYEVVKGFVTPKALYRLLYNNRERLVIFDDCDSVWDNPTTVSLLKAALDSYETRKISWFSESKSEDDDLPQQFEFKGKIIFVSNLALTDLDQAVLSRCLYVDVSMTTQEKIDRIRTLSTAIRTDMPKKMKDEALLVLEENKDRIGDLNIRTFLKVCEVRHRGSDNWKDLAEYVITAL